MSDNVETYKYKGYTINIRHDENAESPRQWDNLCVMACFHGRYNLGDKGHGFRMEDYNGWAEMKAAIIKQEDPAVIFPLFLYDHSGISIQTTIFDCQWDSGQVGFAWVTKKAAKENWGWKKLTKERLETIKKALLGEVATYDDYLRGLVYGYVVEDENGNEIDDGSCWGYFGYGAIKEDGYAVVEAKDAIDHEIERLKEQAEVNETAEIEASKELLDK